MDVIFNCPKCGQELEVDAAGIGQEIDCPSCKETIMIPASSKPSPDPVAAGAPRWGDAAVNPIASSAAAKVTKHLKVPVHDKPQDKLIAKPLVPLEVAAKETDRKLRIKSIRHMDCVEVGHDRFDEMVSDFLAKVGETNLISISAINYSHIDIASHQLLGDYGVLIVFKG